MDGPGFLMLYKAIVRFLSVFIGIVWLTEYSTICRATIPDKFVNIYSKVYSTRHGLPSNSVSSITQDRQGRIWICTQRGVASYDGHDFTTYLERHHQDVSTFYNSINIDTKNRVWIGTTAGIATISQGQIVQLPLNWQGDVSSIQDIREDAQGRIWALCDSAFLSRIDDRSLERPEWENQPDQIVITRLRSSPDGRIWMSTSLGLHILEDGKIKQYPYFSDHTILDFYMETENSGWMIDSTGSLFHFENDRIRKKCILPPAAARTVYDMALTRSGSVWIATFRGLYLFSRDTLSAFDYQDGIASNVVRSVFIDREGCLWYASDNGLGKIPGLMFRRLMPMHNLPVSSVSGICEDLRERLWIAANDGLIRLESNKVKTWRNEDGLIGDSVYSVAPFKDKVLFSTPHGLFEVDTHDKIHRLIDDDSIGFLHIIPEGDRIWLISDEGLFQFSEKGGLKDYTDRLSLKNQSPTTCVYFDSADNMWVSTDGDGVFCIPGSDFSRIQSVNGIPSLRAFSIAEDGNGLIWIGTLAGLCSVKDSTIQNVFSMKQGLMSNDIWTVMIDRENSIWVGTSRGLSSIRDGRIQNYDYEDGLTGEDFVSNCRFMDRNGCLWFGGMGITIIDPSEKMPFISPVTSLRYALMNDQPISEGAQIPAGKNTFEFGFMCSSFRNEQQNKFRYQLKGFDSFRSNPTTSPEVRYTNLTKGIYSFVVEACNRDGQWSESAAEISFEVLPAWYERKLVAALGVCIVLLLIRIFIRWRNYKLARLNIWLRNEVKRQTNIIQQQLYRLEEQKNQLEHQAITDELTNLYNRRHFYRKLQEAWMTSKTEKTPISVVIFDLDHFKEINDTFGHLIGDVTLSSISKSISEVVADRGIVARFGGEEFVILLENTDMHDAVSLAELIRKKIETGEPEQGTASTKVTISGGVATCVASNGMKSPDLLVKAADDALYQAKKSGRNCIIVSGSY